MFEKGKNWPMKWDLPQTVAELLELMIKAPLVPAQERGATILDLASIEAILPHRDPFLFVDRVTLLDLERGLIGTRYSLSQSSAVLAGHFPNHPVWPGVLQVEAVAQAGGLYHLKQTGAPPAPSATLTHILAARFMQPVLPGPDLEVVARVLEDGLFVMIVGQCLQNDTVCSVAALRAL